MGRLYGPFAKPPYAHFIVSPLGAFLKRDKFKVRVIHDLSFPSMGSVNGDIDPADYSLHYSSVDDAARFCNEFEGAFMAKIDLKDAYKHVPVHPSDWHMLGFQWAMINEPVYIYYSKVLNFGLRSAPALFDQFAQALQEFMWYKGATKRIVRYVDDFLIVEGSKSECARSLQVALTTSTDSGFTVQHSKVTPPAKVIEFLGIIIDSQMGELRISEDRIVEVKGILAGWLDKRVGTKRSLLSLIGKLAFAARVVRTGRAFLGRLIALSKKAKYLHYKVRLSRQARADILWWHKCLVSHNGTCLYNVDWSTGQVIHVYTDASNIGFGGLCRGEWFAHLYKGQSESLATMSINWRELHAAIKAMASWAPDLAGEKIIFHIDNMAVCGILNKLYTAVEELMELVRHWCLLLERHSLLVAIVYISTTDNIEADHLSRDKIEKFFEVTGLSPAGRIWPATVPYFNSAI